MTNPLDPQVAKKGNFVHDPFDTDRDRNAVHHTLGDKPWQAARGDHTHDYLVAADLDPYITEAEADAAYAAIGHTHAGLFDDGWTTFRKTANQTNSTTTLADCTDLDTGVLPAGLYVLEAYLLVQTAATTTGIQIGLAYPAQAVGAFNVDVPNSATAAVLVKGRLTDQKAAGTGIGVANAGYLARITGLFRVTGTMASGIKVRFNSEIATSNAIIMADSILRVKKVA